LAENWSSSRTSAVTCSRPELAHDHGLASSAPYWPAGLQFVRAEHAH
jgi:hypothetical protein